MNPVMQYDGHNAYVYGLRIFFLFTASCVCHISAIGAVSQI